jgi:hypothetical protein
MSLLQPFTFNVDVIAASGKDLEAKIVGFTDSTSGATMKTDPTELSAAYTEVAKFSTAKPPSAGGSSSQSSKGGKSKKNRKSKGGKSRKSKKSLRRK